MRSIAFLLRYWPYFGGGETVTRLLASEFLRRGYQVHVLYWWDSYDGRTYEDESRVYKKKIEMPGPYRDGETVTSSYHNLFLVLKEYVELNNIEIVINQWWPSEVFEKKIPAKIISCHHTKVIIYESSKNILRRLYHSIFKKTFIRKGLIRLDGLYQKSELLVFLAASYRNEYNHYSPVYNPLKDTSFVHNPSTYSEPIDYVCASGKKNEVVFVGRIYENYKRLKLLFSVWDEVLKNGVDDWTLKIIGDGPDLNEAKVVADNLKLKNIVFLGSKNPKEDYRTASIFVMTSLFEGWPMTIVEAQHFGVIPVVMNTFSALSEMLSGNSGIIVNSEQPAVMAEKLIELMKDKDRMTILSKNAMEKSLDYDVSKVVDTWEDIFKTL